MRHSTIDHDPLMRARQIDDTPFTLATEPEPRPVPKTPAHRPERRRNEKMDRPSQRQHYQCPPASEPELWFRHTHWNAKRKLVRAALEGAGSSKTQLEAFDNCGADCVVEIDAKTQKYRLRGTYCHNRHCEPCMRAKANLLAANLRSKLNDAKPHQFRFITLTLKHNAAPLADQIRRLYASFKKLRTSKKWKESQLGGVAILEVKWIEKTRRWHPHLHIIAEGSFLKKEWLVAEWHRITGDSMIVDIRDLKTHTDAAYYVAKYVSKGTTNNVWTDTDAAQEWICAMRGVRTAATYGTWRGFKLLEHAKDEGDWRPVGLLAAIVNGARNGDSYYVNLLNALVDSKQYDPGKKRPRKEPKNE